MPNALITGVSGQDGSYLAELLLSKGYTVHGLVRRTSAPRRRIPGVEYIEGDVTDFGSVLEAVTASKPREVYNLAAQSFVKTSFDCPHATFEANATGALNVFEAVLREWPAARVYQASTSEMFGATEGAQNELSPFHPRSPYAVAKVAAHYAAQHYRDRGLFVSCGILFNHESPRRGEEFVTRKITKYLGSGGPGPLQLGALWPCRDWGFAGDYVEAMWAMLQHPVADDFVIATGQTHSVEDFLRAACEEAGLDPDDFIRNNVELVSTHLRPTEVPYLRGDASKAWAELGWEPKTTFREIVKMMVEADVRGAA